MDIELECWNTDGVTCELQKIADVSFEQVLIFVSRLDGNNCSQLFIINPQANSYVTIAGGNDIFLILLYDGRSDTSYHLVNRMPILSNDAMLLIGKQEAEFSKEVCFAKQQVGELLYNYFQDADILNSTIYQWEVD